MSLYSSLYGDDDESAKKSTRNQFHLGNNENVYFANPEHDLTVSDHKTILNVLLQNPEDFELKEKPSAIRENKMFTLDMRKIPISSAKADDNGVYVPKGTVKKSYVYNEEGS